jgi:hypothetical protein
MSRVRKDIFTGGWVIVAEIDAVRPSNPTVESFQPTLPEPRC